MHVRAEVLSGALYVYLRKGASAYADEYGGRFAYLVDFDADGRALGIEILEPWREELVADEALEALASELDFMELLPAVQTEVRVALRDASQRRPTGVVAAVRRASKAVVCFASARIPKRRG